MKKLIAICSIFVFAMAGKVSAQQFIARLTSTRLNEGSNTVIINKLKGTLKFVKQGNSFSNVVFLDSLGSVFTMSPTTGGTNGAPKPECKSTLPDACFSTPNKNIGMCICKPGDISNGGTETYSISLAVPAPAATGPVRAKGVAIRNGAGVGGGND